MSLGRWLTESVCTCPQIHDDPVVVNWSHAVTVALEIEATPATEVPSRCHRGVISAGLHAGLQVRFLHPCLSCTGKSQQHIWLQGNLYQLTMTIQ